MKVFDVLSKEELDISEPITFEKRSSEYILSIPHSGRFIPSNFVDSYNMCKDILIDTDLYTDEVYETDKGWKILTKLSRFLVDMNRNKNRKRITNEPGRSDPLHKKFLDGRPALKIEHSEEEKQWILDFYDKYHGFIERALEEMKKEKGFALLLDCHSLNSVGLPSTPDPGEKRADFIVGTRNDTSADPKITKAFVDVLEASEFSVKMNWPYAGGYITRHYKKVENAHVIQLETRKGTYMDECLDGGDFAIKPDGVRKINKVISEAAEAAAEFIPPQ